MSVRARSVASALFILLVGFWLGRLSAPAASPPEGAQVGGPGRDGLPAPPNVSPPTAPENETVEIAHSPDAWASDPRAALARRMLEWGGDPAQTLEVVIDSMSDRELRIALASLTNFSEEQLDRVRDLRSFARRVAEVAVDSLYDPGAPLGGAPLAEVQFSRAIGAANAPELPQDRFSNEGRIYAVFPMDAYREEEVFVKWFRTDDPEILLFDQYPIQRDADFSYVWLDRENGWAEGEYAVEFYSADETLRQIAEGRYVVDGRLASLEPDAER